MARLTKRQREVLAFFLSFEEEQKRPPNLYEVARFFGITKDAARLHCRALERFGLMAYDNQKRVWRVTIERGSNHA